MGALAGTEGMDAKLLDSSAFKANALAEAEASTAERNAATMDALKHMSAEGAAATMMRNQERDEMKERAKEIARFKVARDRERRREVMRSEHVLEKNRSTAASQPASGPAASSNRRTQLLSESTDVLQDVSPCICPFSTSAFT